MPVTFANDTFTAADATHIEDRSSDSGHTWVNVTGGGRYVVVGSNKAVGDGGAGTTLLYYLNATPASADYTVEADLTIAASSAHGISGRMTADGLAMYLIRYSQATNAWNLLSYTAGTPSTVATYSDTIAIGATVNIRMQMDGTAIRVYRDNELIISATSSAVSAAGFAGLRTSAATDVKCDNFGASILYPSTIAVTSANFVAGLTPYNVVKSGSSYVGFVYRGSGFQVSFSGTDLSANVDVSHLSGYPSGDYPWLLFSVDNGPFSQVLLASTTVSIPLVNGLTDGVHTVDAYLQANVSTYSIMTQADALKITGFKCSTDGSFVARTLRTRNVLILGDSITSGSRLGSGGAPDGVSAPSQAFAEALNARPGLVGIPGQGYTQAGAGGEPDVETSWPTIATGFSRLSSGLISPMPDAIVIAHGTNDTGATDAAVATAVTNTLTAIRAAAPLVPIYVIAAYGQMVVSAIKTGVINFAGNNHLDNEVFDMNITTFIDDELICFIDLGEDISLGISGPLGDATQQSLDFIHPDNRTVSRIAAKVGVAIGWFSATNDQSTSGIIVQRYRTLS